MWYWIYWWLTNGKTTYQVHLSIHTRRPTHACVFVCMYIVQCMYTGTYIRRSNWHNLRKICKKKEHFQCTCRELLCWRWETRYGYCEWQDIVLYAKHIVPTGLRNSILHLAHESTLASRKTIDSRWCWDLDFGGWAFKEMLTVLWGRVMSACGEVSVAWTKGSSKQNANFGMLFQKLL